MRGSTSAKSLILGATGALVAHEVGPGATQTRGAHGLVAVDHHMVLGSLLDDILVVVDHRLAEMEVATGDDIAHIARLDGIIAVAVHQIEGILEMALIVDRARTGLVVHHELHALGVGVLVEILDVEVGIGRDEVEDVPLPTVGPVLPADVPALDEHLLQAVLGREVDITLHVLRIGRMASVGTDVVPVHLVDIDAGQVVGIVPRALADDHLPPHATILRGVDPGRVLDLAGLVEVEDQVGGEHVAGVVADHDRTPGRVERHLHVGLVARGVGGEPRLKDHVLVVEVEVHGGIVDQGCLVDVDIQAVLRLHLQGGLDSRLGEVGHGRVGPVDGIMETGADLGEAALLGLLLLRVVVARQPPGCMVASHGKLRVLLLDDEIDEAVLLGELIAEAHAVVIDAEADVHLASCVVLGETDEELVVVIADSGRLAPDGLPGLVEGGDLRMGLGETVHEARLGEALGGVLVLGELQSEVGGLDDGTSLVGHLVGRPASIGQREGNADGPIGRGDRLCGYRKRQQQGGK